MGESKGMRLEIDIAEHHYNNIMALDSVSLGRVPYKGIIMYSINAIKHGKVLEQEPTTKNDLGVDCISRIETIDYLCKHCPDDGECFKDCDEIKHLKQMPSVTPQEPRKGHWIENAEEYYKAINEKGGGVNENTPYFVDDIACSECLAKFSVIDNEAERFDFCPCCGSNNK